MNVQRQRRALVIDDDIVVRDVLGEVVTSFGYSTDVAASGPEGLALFDKRPHDVVLTDLRMPVMTGWEVLAAVRARDPRIPVIILTGSAVWADDERFSQPGIVLVKKPVEPHVLLEAISRALVR